MDPISRRIAQMNERVASVKERNLYFYLQEIEELDGPWVTVRGRRMLIFASYSYLGLLGHPKIAAAAQAAIAKYGTGTHGVRILAGTLPLHRALEEKIAAFKGAEDAIVYSSGYVTNLTTISSLVGRNDVVICDKLNHASIVDGCLLSRAKFVRFGHNNMAKLEEALAKVPANKVKLVVADAVFSMDGDIINLPELSRLAKKYEATLMIDEAHSLGVLGKTGRGIEEYFGLEGVVDIKMGTLSKCIPSVGGYIAASTELITYLQHTSRAFIFSAALPPAATAAAKAAFEVIEEEPERLVKLWRNVEHFIGGLKERGFNTLNSETPVVPIITVDDDKAMMMTRLLQGDNIFVLPVVPPAVPVGTSRLRANVTAAHSEADIDLALEAFYRAGKSVGVI